MMERQWGGCALARLLKEGPEFKLRPKESGDYQPWEDLREECSRLGECKCEGPVVGANSACLRSSKGARVAGPGSGR